MAAKLKKGDHVIVLAGRDKGKEGDVLRVMPTAGRAVVSGINMVIRHTRQTQNDQGDEFQPPPTALHPGSAGGALDHDSVGQTA